MKQDCEIKRLGDLFVFKNGRAFRKEEWSDSGLPIIRIQNLNSEDASFNHFSGEYSQDIFVGSGDLLFSWSGTVGSSFGSHIWNGKPGLLNQHIFKVAHRESIDRRYAFYGLQFITAEIEKTVSGAVGLVHITKAKLNEFTLPLPSLFEQRRIVALLDEAFEALATAKANAEQNLENARSLFESHLESVFTKQDPESEQHVLGELIEIQNGFAFKSSEYTDSGYFVIRISNVQDGVITLGNPRFLKLADKRLERFILNEGDILVSLTGNIGRVGVVQEDHLPAVLNQRVARITIRQYSVERDFLFRFLMSRSFREKLQAAGHGAAQQNVSTQKIETVRLSLPSKEDQRRIANEFDNFAAEIQRLTSIYERKLAALEELKASLLHRAFSGEM